MATDTGADGGSAAEDSEGTSDGAGRDPFAPEFESIEVDCGSYGTERPSRMSEHAAAFDDRRQELVVFGGTDWTPEACGFTGPMDITSQVWVYSEPCNAWSKLDANGLEPVARSMAAVGDDALWVWGGRFRSEELDSGAYTLRETLHRFDLASRQWSIPDVQGAGPAARASGAMAWDKQHRVLWLYGGDVSPVAGYYDPQSDVWSYSPDAGDWARHAQGAGPGRRMFHAMLYDERREQLVVFAGSTDGFTYFSDLWAFDVKDNEWRELPPGGRRPPNRFRPGLVHDVETDTYLAFGGHDDTDLGNRNDLWRYDPEAQSWSEVFTGDSYAVPARGLCDFPPDFATIDAASPERRNFHAQVWSQRAGQMLIFGGKTDCGSTDDVWAFDGDSWEEKLPAREGEACIRWRDDPDRCTDMCF